MLKAVLLFILISLRFVVSAQEIPNDLLISTTSKVSSENFTIVQHDSLKLDNNIVKHYSTGNILGQTLVGSLCATAFAALPFSATSSKLGSKDQVNAASAVLTIAWYTFGAAVGVHWIAKSENPELSFWGTFGSAVIGTGVGFGLVSVVSSAFTDPPYFSAIITALCPIISSMIYASFISEWPSESQNVVLQKKNYSHRDLIEQSKLFEAELFRFYF